MAKQERVHIHKVRNHNLDYQITIADCCDIQEAIDRFTAPDSDEKVRTYIAHEANGPGIKKFQVIKEEKKLVL